MKQQECKGKGLAEIYQTIDDGKQLEIPQNKAVLWDLNFDWNDIAFSSIFETFYWFRHLDWGVTVLY